MADNNDEIVVEVDVEPVDNRLPLMDLLPQMAQAMAAETQRAVADPSVSRAVEDRMRNVTRLAQQLAQELQQVQSEAPHLRLVDTRPVRLERPTRPVEDHRPGRSLQPDRARVDQAQVRRLRLHLLQLLCELLCERGDVAEPILDRTRDGRIRHGAFRLRRHRLRHLREQLHQRQSVVDRLDVHLDDDLFVVVRHVTPPRRPGSRSC